jgi:nucleoside-diphosphate-sugar epimerase
MQIHTVLGASGAIGRAVIKELQNRNLTIRAVERKRKLFGIETIEADLLDAEQAVNAIQTSSYVYLCVGLPYQSKVWAKDWPQLMRNVINACTKTNAKLIFLDNMYMYSQPLTTPFDETYPQNPITKKGLARKATSDLLLQAMAEKKVHAVIGRSADIYGELSTNSLFYISFLENMMKGKAPQVLGKKDVKHTYAYTGDNGEALVALALDEKTYGQVWHLPVGEPITIDAVNEMLNEALGTTFKVSYVSKVMRKILSLFIPPITEVEEMLYQFESPYEMSCKKFMTHFPDFKITPYQEGISKMVQSFNNRKQKI